MSMGVRSWRFSSSSTPNINEASHKDVAAPLHKNVPPWSVWRGHEEGKERASPSLSRVTQSGRADYSPHSRPSNLFRTASVPDVVADGGNPETAFSSITISARKVAQSGSSMHPETFCPSRATGPMRALTPLVEPYRSRAFSGMQSTKCAARAPVSQPSMNGSRCAMRSSVSQPDLCRQVPTITRTEDFNQGSSTCDRVTIRGPGNRKAQTLEHRHSFTEGDRSQDLLGDSTTLSSSRSYCSRVDLQVPLRTSSTVVFLDRSLSLSLVELEGRRATPPALHTSTLSVRLRGSSCQELFTDNKPAQTDGGYRRTKAATGGGNKRTDPENSLSKQRGHKVEKTALAHGVNREADDSDMRSHGTAWRSPLWGPSYTEATRRNGNADEAARSTQGNFSCRHRTSSTSPVNSQTRGRQSLGQTKDQQGHGCSSARDALMTWRQREMTCHRSQQLDSLNVTRRILSLKEALELFRPDFISRSQGRVRRLEQKTQRRRALQDSSLDLTQQGPREDGGGTRRRNCTTPHPLSDNLFRPRERSISGREMQLRSKRIYKRLPEVTNKKKEERKRAVSQTNRLRAEVFKKKLLDQILQR